MVFICNIFTFSRTKKYHGNLSSKNNHLEDKSLIPLMITWPKDRILNLQSCMLSLWDCRDSSWVRFQTMASFIVETVQWHGWTNFEIMPQLPLDAQRCTWGAIWRAAGQSRIWAAGGTQHRHLWFLCKQWWRLWEQTLTIQFSIKLNFYYNSKLFAAGCLGTKIKNLNLTIQFPIQLNFY